MSEFAPRVPDFETRPEKEKSEEFMPVEPLCDDCLKQGYCQYLQELGKAKNSDSLHELKLKMVTFEESECPKLELE